MKKIITLFVLILSVIISAGAQNATEILDRFLKVTNLDAISAQKSNVVSMELVNTVNQNGNKMQIDMNVIAQNPGGKLRMDMDMMGQQMIIVVNGDKGWLQAQGQVQELPAEQARQMAAQGDYLQNMKFDTERNDFKFIKEENGMLVVECTPKDDSKQANKATLYFNKESGLQDRVVTNVQGQDVVIDVSDYKDFNGCKIPAKMTISVAGNELVATELTKFELNTPVTESTFSKPQ